jgi:aspartyl/asparaginyl beta-hydroxylase (cupin superfamily)
MPDTTNHEEKRLEPVKEKLYTEICPEFKGTYAEEVYEIIRKRWKVGRVRFLMKPPRTCLSWHRDPEMRLHIPIITNKGCKMVIEDTAFHMPANGSGYVTDNTKYHNFFNGSEIERVHLVATILQGNLDDMHLSDESWRDEVKFD